MTLVGLVRSVKESQTRLDYEIDDLTGPPLEVKQFVDNDVSCSAYCNIIHVTFSDQVVNMTSIRAHIYIMLPTALWKNL